MTRKFLKDEDVANMLGVSIDRLRAKLSSGDLLPPRVELPGCRIRLWDEEEFFDWLKQYEVRSCSDLQKTNHRMLNFRQKGVK